METLAARRLRSQARPDGPTMHEKPFVSAESLRSGVPVLMAAVLGALLLVGCISEPAHVARLTVDNPTDYDVLVTVSAPNDRGSVALGTARRRGESTFESILDQGEVWVFRFEAQGEDGGELRMTREQLEADGWQLLIPDSVSERLQEKGAPIPP